MRYVGIPNSPEKSAMIRQKADRKILVRPADLAWDCTRHIAFLRMVDGGVGYPSDRDLLASDYCRYLISTGRDVTAALLRASRFLRIYTEWSEANTTSPWSTVTEDGLRLDGSHRAAVAMVVGHPVVWVRLVPYRPEDAPWRAEMQAWRKKRLAERKEEAG